MSSLAVPASALKEVTHIYTRSAQRSLHQRLDEKPKGRRMGRSPRSHRAKLVTLVSSSVHAPFWARNISIPSKSGSCAIRGLLGGRSTDAHQMQERVETTRSRPPAAARAVREVAR